MTKRKGDHTPLSDALKDFVKTHKLEKGLDNVSARDAWHSVLGEAISNYTTEVKLDRDTLYVRLSSSVLREELSYGKEKIIRLLNEALNKELITKLVLR